MVLLAGGILAAPMVAHAQSNAAESTNILASDPTLIEQGRIQFRQWCAHCHGREARGGAKGPDLSRPLRHGDTDAALRDTILQGLLGTQVPASDLSEQEIAQIVAFLRSLAPAPAGPTAGNAKAGEDLFWGDAKCSTCHMVGGRGGRRGPDLSRVGVARPSGFLAESIREPSRHLTERMAPADFGTTPIRYTAVSVTPKTGEEVTGLLVTEDTFTIILMDASEGLHSYSKKELRALRYSKTSLMPAYDEQALSPEQLQDLLAYLDGLRGR
jgi:putative heme-binding domain-containing protein